MLHDKIRRLRNCCLWLGCALVAGTAVSHSRAFVADGAPQQQISDASAHGTPGQAGQIPPQPHHGNEALQGAGGNTSAARESGYGESPVWWQAGSGRALPAEATYDDPAGTIEILNTSGQINTKDHPFFTPLGTNGRACVTCHQPADGMSVSVASLQKRWLETKGQDPIFDAVDGSNCPDLPQSDESSHSLLLNRGLFRIFLPWPPRSANGTPIKPEFTIGVIRDPTGCNTDPKYGLHSGNPMISVYRRPRVVANMKYVMFAVGTFTPKQLAMPLGIDPDTGKTVGLNMLSDARDLTLKSQAIDAALNHEQSDHVPTNDQLAEIQNFELQVFSAQKVDRVAGTLVEKNGPTELGPKNLAQERPGLLGDNLGTPVFGNFDMWKKPGSAGSPEQAAAQASIARGFDVFFSRPFWIRDSQHINTIGLGNPVKRTCSTCHNARMTGQDLMSGWVDLGVTNLPWAGDQPDLPLFKITCDPKAPPHAFLGRVIYTHDPGRALISGKCFDVGSIVMQQFRGLAARAPYFSDGSAQNMRELVDFYDRRYNIGYSEQEKEDLVHFLNTL
jgi:hypothetical protein